MWKLCLHVIYIWLGIAEEKISGYEAIAIETIKKEWKEKSFKNEQSISELWDTYSCYLLHMTLESLKGGTKYTWRNNGWKISKCSENWTHRSKKLDNPKHKKYEETTLRHIIIMLLKASDKEKNLESS